MKKFICPLVLAILLGFVSARIVYSLYSPSDEVKNNCYFLQIGAYHDPKVLENVTKKLETFLVVNDDDKNYVYIGITSNKENADKIKKIYEEKGSSIYIKEKYINNIEFYNNLIQYDILLSEVEKKEDIISISKVILSSYEEIASDI